MPARPCATQVIERRAHVREGHRPCSKHPDERLGGLHGVAPREPVAARRQSARSTRFLATFTIAGRGAPRVSGQ